MEIYKVRPLARELMNKHGLSDWTFVMRNYKTAFGKCHYRYKTISLSNILTPHCTEDSVRNTVLHEIAHAKAGRIHGHDHVWRSIFISLGGNGKTRGGNDEYAEGVQSAMTIRETHYNYVGTCPNGHIHYRNRQTRNRQSCSKCSRRFDERFLITWKRNI